jgi:small subunit ribosomal protein S15
MSLNKEVIKEKVMKYGKSEKDTGSVEVQISLLTERINVLMKHFETHKKDLLTRRNFLKLIGQRKRLLKYLKRTNEESYKKLVKDLGL